MYAGPASVAQWSSSGPVTGPPTAPDELPAEVAWLDADPPEEDVWCTCEDAPMDDDADPEEDELLDEELDDEDEPLVQADATSNARHGATQ